MFDSTCGTSESLLKSYVTPTPRLRDNWGGLVEIKLLRSVTANYWTLFYSVNCARPSEFFENRSSLKKYVMKWRPIKWAFKRKPSRLCWRRKIGTKETLLYTGGAQQNAYFYSSGHYVGCGQISFTKTIRDLGPQWYRIRNSTGVDFKIQGGQQKYSY